MSIELAIGPVLQAIEDLVNAKVSAATEQDDKTKGSYLVAASGARQRLADALRVALTEAARGGRRRPSTTVSCSPSTWLT